MRRGKFSRSRAPLRSAFEDSAIPASDCASVPRGWHVEGDSREVRLLDRRYRLQASAIESDGTWRLAFPVLEPAPLADGLASARAMVLRHAVAGLPVVDSPSVTPEE
jgi:hypothetical protein